jgi:hypothetical protein
MKFKTASENINESPGYKKKEAAVLRLHTQKLIRSLKET